ncbi:hypothetical protein [Stenotrophomonas sp. S39]|uniref:hypothetical protein n=1 Tax=Stenotrophomonas sp. S39 TaxID=2767451 RepID=UPI001909E2B7|nr:hypothetical protein [Stenotrophomonas sp. S39]MBK0053767.1 hypothetical protein [Stenotrophomonas sp. S39]
MSAKINVLGIVKAHLMTLRNHSAGRISLVDWSVFFICPLIIGVVVYLSLIPLTESLVAALINAAAILLGLLLNLLVLMFDQRTKVKDLLDKLQRPQASVDAKRIRHVELRRNVIDESVANISFAVLLCLCSLVSLLVFTMAVKSGSGSRMESFVYAMNAFIWINVMLTILMVIKRVYALFSSVDRAG